jgi:hypothetical protein
VNGSQLIAAKRARQVGEEGWTAEHDAEHNQGEMVMAAMAYISDLWDQAGRWASPDPVVWDGPPDQWPRAWHESWWKPTPGDPIRQLVKAGALIAAEIDRLQGVSANKTPASANRTT